MKFLTPLVALLAMVASASAQQQQPQQRPSAKQAPATKQAPQPAAKPGPKSPFTPPAFKITIATEGAFPPFNYLDRKGMPAGFEIEAVLRECGMKDIVFLDQAFPYEFCDDCGMPLYPNSEGEVVHPELPEQANDAPQTLH